MILKSFIYPEVKIEEAVLIELINSKPIQRLKKIHVAGYHLVAGNHRDSTRYEHSVGVMHLLNLFGAKAEEQVAGLLHDISHTAFSHVSTYVLKDNYEGEEFHERKKQEFVEKTEIPQILKKYNIDQNYVLEDKNFSLLENDLPDICADRIDYSLRDSLIWQFASKDQIRKILKSLTTNEESFIFKDIRAASYFAELFFMLNQALYGSAYNAYFNHRFGNLLKEAISRGILSNDAWFTDDFTVLEILKKSGNPAIKKCLQEFDGKMVIYEDQESPQHTFSKKLRIVDPPILIRGKIERLSNLDGCYKDKIEKYRKEHPEHIMKLSCFKRKHPGA